LGNDLLEAYRPARANNRDHLRQDTLVIGKMMDRSEGQHDVDSLLAKRQAVSTALNELPAHRPPVRPQRAD